MKTQAEEEKQGVRQKMAIARSCITAFICYRLHRRPTKRRKMIARAWWQGGGGGGEKCNCSQSFSRSAVYVRYEPPSTMLRSGLSPSPLLGLCSWVYAKEFFQRRKKDKVSETRPNSARSLWPQGHSSFAKAHPLQETCEKGKKNKEKEVQYRQMVKVYLCISNFFRIFL